MYVRVDELYAKLNVTTFKIPPTFSFDISMQFNLSK